MPVTEGINFMKLNKQMIRGLLAVLLSSPAWVSAFDQVAVKYSGHDAEYLRELGVTVVLDRRGNEFLRQACRAEGIAYWRIYNVFTRSNPSIAESENTMVGEDGNPPQGHMAGRDFFSPAWESMRSAKLKAIVDDVAALRPDGISLDMVRWYLESDTHDRPRREAWEWESIGPDDRRSAMISFSFDGVTLRRFQSETGIRLDAGTDDPQAAARELRTQHNTEWAGWKAAQVTQAVAAIREAVRRVDPDIRIMVQLVPWAETEHGGALQTVTGQDPAGLAGVTDVFSPMTYHALLGRPAGWITTYARQLQERTGVAVWPCIQAMGHGRSDREPFTGEAVEAAWRAVASGPFVGLALYGPHEDDIESRQLLRRLRLGTENTSIP